MKTPQVEAIPGTSPLGLAKASPPYVFRAMAIRRAIAFYLETGMRVNSAYTPKNMLATAGHITGQKYGTRLTAKLGEKVIADLGAWIDAQK